MGTTDLSINKLSVDVSSDYSATGVSLGDTDDMGSAKYRISDANIKVSGGEEATLTGYLSSSSDEATTSTIIGNINIQSLGGKKSR